MRVAVMGAGGIGGYYGGMLARAGEEVTFIARGAQLEAMRDRGLTVKTTHVGDFTLPVQATSDPGEIGPVDLVLFLCQGLRYRRGRSPDNPTHGSRNRGPFLAERGRERRADRSHRGT